MKKVPAFHLLMLCLCVLVTPLYGGESVTARQSLPPGLGVSFRPTSNATGRATRLSRPVRAIDPQACTSARARKGSSDTSLAWNTHLPSPEKIVGDYIAAIGGIKSLSLVRDATMEWVIQAGETKVGRAVARTRAPDSARTDITLSGVSTSAAATPRSAWRLNPDGVIQTMTDDEAGRAKLRALLDASGLVGYKKQNVMARTVGVEETGGETSYVVEFTLREGGGARLKYSFSAVSKLLIQVADEGRRTVTRFRDYHPVASSRLLAPRRLEILRAVDSEPLVLTLVAARYNTNIDARTFDPPGEGGLDVAALLREVERNQTAADIRLGEYTYTLTDTELEITDRGEVKNRRVRVFEVYPVPGGRSVKKLLSEDSVPLAPERLTKEERRVAGELEKAERGYQNGRVGGRGGRGGGGANSQPGPEDEGIDVGAFLRACEFISPRRESFRGRETIVFDFRPRHGYKPQGFCELVISKSEGVVWIDPADKQVVRLETRLPERYKIAGGLFASVGRGTGFSVERMRLADGVWVPRSEHYGASFKVLLVAGVRLNGTREYADYRRFSTKVQDHRLEAPVSQ